MKRNRRAGVEDRWTKTVRDKDGNTQKVPSARRGRGLRWMARFVDNEGRELTKSFDRKVEAQRWLDTEVTAKLVTGNYVAPRAGLVTVGAVHSSWSASQGHISPKTAATRKSVWNSCVKTHWADVAVVDVKTAGVRAWVSKMVTDEVGAPTIQNAFGVLRQVLGAAVEDSRIARNPCDGVSLPKRKHSDRGYLSHRQVVALASAVARQGEVSDSCCTPACGGVRWPRFGSRTSTCRAAA